MAEPTRTKGDKRQRTRAKLIEATSELVREKGFERISMEDIAERAGMTRGAIYGNFKDKDELFLAIARIRGAPLMPKFKPGGSFAEQMAILAETVIEAIPQRRDAIIGTLSFHSYSLKHEEMRLLVLDQTAMIYRVGAEWLRTVVPAEELPMPAETLMRVLHGMMDGLLLQRFLTPELNNDDVIRAAFAALAGVRSP